MNSLGTIYRQHHEKNRGVNFTLFLKERFDFFSRHIGTGKKVLDVGCRDCALTKHFKGNVLYGVDIDARALEFCQAAGVQVKQSDLNAESWGFEPESFDAIIAGEIVEHVYYPRTFLEKLFRMLKNGGILVGSTPNAFSLKNRFRLLVGRKKGTPLEDPTHINHFSYSELAILLKAAGFSEVKIEPLVVKSLYRPLAHFFPGLVGFSLLFRAKKPGNPKP